ncbi:MAG: ATPase, T2SS/T4P/T4SS family [Actinomycetota bacterium]|nr:ATPase, T2SS/T4P/T4SS family [Actinomycetota bacterium]
MRLGQLLIEKKVISTAQLEEALKRMKDLSLPLGETLIKLKFVSEDMMLETLSRHLGVEAINISENDYSIVDMSLSRTLPLEVCQQYKVLPVFRIMDTETKELTLAMANPLDSGAIGEAEALTGCRVTPVLATSSSIEKGIAKLYSLKISPDGGGIEIEEGSAVSLVNDALQKAVALGASDIHIEPHAREAHIRMRIDGVLEPAAAYPLSKHAPIVSRIKIMASEQNSLMKIEERRLPQDGSFSRDIMGHAVDCRVSSMPNIFGEKVVIRIFDKDKVNYVSRIKDLRMPARMELRYRRCVRQPSGINIVTGPTGSGKTTTLHAVINEINSPGINIVTVEDPVEYQAPDYVNQSTLMPQADYTYARALRAIMRQDPDVILIGEVRDRETAEIAVQAALTGHRVFTTLHTEDAAGSIARLIDIGVQHFLVSATVVSAVNQRLVRKICPNCAEDFVPTRVEMLDSGLDGEMADQILSAPVRFSMGQGKGCSLCRQTGYRGRQGVFELIVLRREIRELIHRKMGSADIVVAARASEGLNMLFEEGLRLFLKGVTTLGELQALPRGDYKLKPLDNILADADIH